VFRAADPAIRACNLTGGAHDEVGNRRRPRGACRPDISINAQALYLRRLALSARSAFPPNASSSCRRSRRR